MSAPYMGVRSFRELDIIYKPKANSKCIERKQGVEETQEIVALPHDRS